MDGNGLNGTMPTMHGFPANGHSHGHVVTNAPGMSAGMSQEDQDIRTNPQPSIQMR